jgi:hypothetical protein
MSDSAHDRSSRSAQAALDALGTELGDREVLSIQCHRSHHVGAIYSTPPGLVVRLPVGPRSHGSKDFEDSAHGAAHHGEYVDFLDPDRPDVDDRVPGWCACGGWTLSRADLRTAVEGRVRTLRIG